MSATALPAVSPLDERVYRAIAAHAFDEARCFPSQKRIALDLGLARQTVCRSVGRLIKAGWLEIVERRWSKRTRWCHNVYELLAPFAVSALAAKRITRRARQAAKQRTLRVVQRALRNRAQSAGDTNGVLHDTERCGCRSCRVEQASIRRRPPPDRDLAHPDRGDVGRGTEGSRG